MGAIGKPKRETQDRVIALFRDTLGYRYLGDWSDRDNRNVEESLLRPWLARRGYGTAQIDRALDVLGRELGHTGRDLYHDNQAVYGRLRYGVPVKVEAGKVAESVFLIDWDKPQANDFAIAEEVTLKGGFERRPDLVLYVNGIAVAAIELKNSRVSIGEGIRQLLSNQKPEFNAAFFRTVQLVFEAFIAELGSQPCQAQGELFVFVDECHRTQSGRLHKVMKALLPNAVFIGFTSTPLLKKDKATSLEVFGGYIHTYKFGEAVADEVVLDLVYEARDIDQKPGSPEHVDQWFEAKTRGLNDWQKDELKKTWGTLRRVLSSRSRMERVVEDIVFDFSVKPRLSSERGNAMLVAGVEHPGCVQVLRVVPEDATQGQVCSHHFVQSAGG